jgi:gliding motility associated protien GldN
MNRYLLILFLSFCINCFAQPNLLNARTPDEIGKKTEAQIEADNKKPIEYGFVNDNDLLFGKKIWEYIDINERINMPLYYPTKPLMDRMSLFDVLREYIESSKQNNIDIKKFCFQDDYFSVPLESFEVDSKFYEFKLTDEGENKVNNSLNPTKIDPSDEKNYKKLCLKLIFDKKIKEGPDFKTATISAADIVGYKIQGYWYFDKRLSELKYRLIAIAPIATSAKNIVDKTFGDQAIEDEFEELKKNQGSDLTEDQLKTKQDKLDIYNDLNEADVLFWIYYPAIRNELKLHPCLNDTNSSKPITFDDLLISRRFNAIIYKEENVYEDREIKDYMKDNAHNQLLESERVKEKIRNFEHDMWNY